MICFRCYGTRFDLFTKREKPVAIKVWGICPVCGLELSPLFFNREELLKAWWIPRIAGLGLSKRVEATAKHMFLQKHRKMLCDAINDTEESEFYPIREAQR